MKYLWIILFALVLAAPFAVRRALAPRSASAAAGGPASNSGAALRLVVVTPDNQDIRNEFARAFDLWHRRHYGAPVTLDFRVPGGSTDVKRLLNTTFAAYRDAHGKLSGALPADFDVAWGGGDYLFARELDPGILQPIHLSPELLKEFRAAFPKPTLAGVRLYDPATAPGGAPTPRWIGVCLSSFGICYNPDVYRSIGLPAPSPQQGWRELTDPRLRGFVALADPSHSGSAAVAYQMVLQRAMADAETAFFEKQPASRKLSAIQLQKDPAYRAAIARGWKAGMGQLLKIAANARYFTDSSTLVPMDVSRGEAAAGMAIDFYARVTQESVGADRMQFIAPIGATAITPDPVGILAGAKSQQLELAERFVTFLLSREGQLLWILKAGVPGGPVDRSLRRPPIRFDLYADEKNWADDVNPYQTAHGFNQRAAWMALFGDTRPIWVAAWIDSRDALEDAYGKILKISDPALRARRIDELADLPIEMRDVEAIRAERLRLAGSPTQLDLWSARQQIEWAERFRQHYRAVAGRN